MFGDEPERYWEIALKESAHTIVTDVARLRKRPNVLIICGPHNKILAEYIMLESRRVGTHPSLWMFDENFFLKSLTASKNLTTVVLKHVLSLVEKSSVIIWLSQFEDVERFPADLRKVVYSFWDEVERAVKPKPCLFVNLPSPKYIQALKINYLEFLAAFINGVKADYGRLRETSSNIASRLGGHNFVRVYHTNGTDLEFSIKDRRVEVEDGTLEDCYSTGRECGIDAPGGEVYVAPVETSANGILVVDEHKEHDLKGLRLQFRNGRIIDVRARRGGDAFAKLLKEAKGAKDRIAELGIGANYGMKPVGWSIYDEKALGTVHIAIGNNVHLGGVNEASIHIDFVLNKPTIKADKETVMEQGRFLK